MLNFEPFVFVQESMQGFSNKDNIYNNAGTVALEDFFYDKHLIFTVS